MTGIDDWYDWDAESTSKDLLCDGPFHSFAI